MIHNPKKKKRNDTQSQDLQNGYNSVCVCEEKKRDITDHVVYYSNSIYKRKRCEKCMYNKMYRA